MVTFTINQQRAEAINIIEETIWCALAVWRGTKRQWGAHPNQGT